MTRLKGLLCLIALLAGVLSAHAGQRLDVHCFGNLRADEEVCFTSQGDLYTSDGDFVIISSVTFATIATFSDDLVKTPVSVESISAAGTITADSCGGIKLITAVTGPLTTSTDNTFESTATAPSGCVMYVTNIGSTTITLDFNTQFSSTDSANVPLPSSSTVIVGAISGRGWFQFNSAGY